MKVVPIRSKLLFGNFYPRAHELTSEGMKFLAGVALTFWAPTLLFCYVIGQFLPFYLMSCNQALGVLLGILMYNKPSNGILSCVPVNRMGSPKLRKAA
jgi:hypothetical protein